MLDFSPIDWNHIVSKIKSFATSAVAREGIEKLSRLETSTAAEKSLREITEARGILSGGERPFMESLDFYSTWHHRLVRGGALQTVELRDVRRFLLESMAFREITSMHSGAWVDRLRNDVLDASPPLSAIDQIMSPSGEIRSDASETLYRLYQEKTNLTKQLQQTLDRLVKAHDMDLIVQEKFVTTREGRLVIPVKGGMQHFMPGIIHGSSQTKQTVYMEPEEVVPMNNRLRQVELEIEQEIERILIALSDYLRSLKDEMSTTFDALLEADLCLAKAKFADSIMGVPCRFQTHGIELNGLRHPILVLQGEDVIANTVRLGKGHRILLLSGPNAGGKTVLLKSIGLAAHMARCGLPICAEEGAALPFFENILIGVGDAQSVDAHLSTFAAHLKILNSAAQYQGPNNLLLIDEICGSTDPEEGSALARSFIEHYGSNQVFAVITSHLSPLKSGFGESSGVVNGSLEYDQKTGRPTYQFLLGIAGQSLALQTAKRVGVDQGIIAKALSFLTPEARRQQQNIEQIESLKEELRILKTDLEKQAHEVREKKRLYQDLLQKFRIERDQWMDRLMKKAEKKVDDLIERSKVENIFKKHETLQKIKSEMPELVKAGPASSRRIETLEDFERIYPPGSVVHIPSLGKDGVTQGRANSKGEIPVLSNSMRIFVPWNQLKPPQSMVNPTAQVLRRSSGVQVQLLDQDRVVDLRGQRADDALGFLETQLDAASLNSESRVKIVHGHGTEALKKAVRSHLSRSVYVKKWSAGASESGGDGITWAELKD